MKLNQTLIAIRPRSVLERLDLSFLLCGSYPVGILCSLMAGVIPCLLFNWWFLTWLDDEISTPLVVLLYFEIPFSTVFLSLYLGQMTFFRTFSISEAFKTLLKQLPLLIIYQIILRGICGITFLLLFVVAFGMYHMNEIILLERSSLKSSWMRRRVLHDDRMGDIIVSRLVEFVVLLLSFYWLTILFFMVTGLWNDQTRVEDLFAFDNRLILETDFLFCWQTSFAFFISVGFLRIYRFVTYLDSRIRNEGWDVELKLRTIAQSYQ
ncbi:hypothetical protein [uncultured Rubinisphaera sp.]|uniref:hypothetical protein n=1 Tax=uncultured Rubinisphaera sp. TaxID=1678686 RepID=UPI0030D6E566|tara:strand:+ start:1158 stop:1952 length:795 start_codon:yes stop_codon:yes gene_type:complete